MKKTLTVNLGGTVFNIDEDAYQLLDKYLANLRIHFRKEEGAQEIMDDFEMRISELLGERVRLGHEVITIEQVELIIDRMGKPEEIFEEEEKQTAGGETEDKTILEIKQPARKRLMRDPDNRILGGVAGGFAAYMDWDPTPVRIALVALIFFYGFTIPVYLLLWLIIPMASTATEKLQMRGESITIESIGKTVTGEFEKVTTRVNDYIHTGKPRTGFQKFADGFVEVLGIFLKVFLIILGIILIPPLLLVLFVMVIVAMVVIFGSNLSFFTPPFPFTHWDTFAMQIPDTALIGTAISTVLLIGIPIVLIVFALGSHFFKFKPLSSHTKWVMLVLFVGALIVNIYFAAKYGLNIWETLGWDHWNRTSWHSHSHWNKLQEWLGWPR